MGVGFGPEQLGEMQRVINAEKCDLFDVLAYVAYALAPLTRAERAAAAQRRVRLQFSPKEQAFIDFVLGQYVEVGVEELAQDKLSPLLRLLYRNAIADAVADLGEPEKIAGVFAGFQKFLYSEKPTGEGYRPSA